MTDDQRRVVLAAALWAIFALILWNVLFDYGVRTTASRYLVQRSAYLHGHGPRVEMAPAMHAGIASSLRTASMLASPCVLVAGSLARRALRRNIKIGNSK
jgi:hypothetical protein